MADKLIKGEQRYCCLVIVFFEVLITQLLFSPGFIINFSKGFKYVKMV